MDRHLLLDGALHSFQTDAELVLEELTNRAYATVSKVIDVVRLVFRRVLAHLQDIAHDFVEVFRGQQRIVDSIELRFAHLDVELQTSNTREVKLPRIEEHRLEQSIGR